MPSIVNLGQVRDPEEILETLLAVTGQLECKDEKQKEVLLRTASECHMFLHVSPGISECM